MPAQYDPKTPAAVMVFNDGGGYIDRKGNHPALNVIDNLIAQHKIPVMIAVFPDPAISPALPAHRPTSSSKRTQRSGRVVLKIPCAPPSTTRYSDRYARFLRDELLAEVGKKYNLRKDAYSHAITGLSSGGITSFNAAWQMPDEFSRVIS